MGKKSQLERAIEGLNQEIAILQAAKYRLIGQIAQQKPRARRPRVVAAPAPAERSA